MVGRISLWALSSCAALCVACGDRTAVGPSLEIFAASSLRDAITEVGGRFARRHAVQPSFNLAGSNVLAQQIIAAQRGDVFVSADAHWLDAVAEAGHLLPGSRREVLGNTLAVVARADSKLTLADPRALAAVPFRHLAIGDPRAVPVGIYAKAYLEGLLLADGDNVWQQVEARTAPLADARAALGMVEADPEVLGILYASDATASRRVRVLYAVPASEGPRVRYVAGLVRRSGASTMAPTFLDFISTPEAGEVFTRFGFAPLAD